MSSTVAAARRQTSARVTGTAAAVDVLAVTARPIRALAMFYDGSIDSRSAVRGWAQSLHPFGGGVDIDEHGLVIVTEPWREGQVELAPGCYLVYAQSGAYCWAVFSPGQLTTWLQRRPRELPIFPDGEVSE